MVYCEENMQLSVIKVPDFVLVSTIDRKQNKNNHCEKL